MRPDKDTLTNSRQGFDSSLKRFGRRPRLRLLLMILLVTTGLAGLYWRWHQAQKSLSQPNYKTEPSALQPSNERGNSGGFGNETSPLLVTQYQRIDGTFDLVFGEDPKFAGKNPIPLGYLHRRPLKPEAGTPVFLCETSLPGPSGSVTQQILDTNERCSSTGRRLQAAPLGYVSDLIRPHYSLVVRCLRPKKGYYFTHNARCDDPDDLYQANLGTLLGAITQPKN